VLSLSENNGIHKQALIDRKAMTRVYLDFISLSLRGILRLHSACQHMALIPLKMALIPMLINNGLPSIEV
jgi:hypothetical protein